MTLTNKCRRTHGKTCGTTILQSGFSLLEMVVAIAILSLSLGMLYQATSGATRNVRSAEKYAYGVELARSLLADNALVPVEGKSAKGETEGGFRWSMQTSPIDLANRSLPRGELHTLEVRVSWSDGTKRRKVMLTSVVGGYAP
ncbi:MAG: general secretion pathway protein I [Halioglobus sp.]|jgi:general secretion pathway protein I